MRPIHRTTFLLKGIDVRRLLVALATIGLLLLGTASIASASPQQAPNYPGCTDANRPKPNASPKQRIQLDFLSVAPSSVDRKAIQLVMRLCLRAGTGEQIVLPRFTVNVYSKPGSNNVKDRTAFFTGVLDANYMNRGQVIGNDGQIATILVPTTEFIDRGNLPAVVMTVLPPFPTKPGEKISYEPISNLARFK